MPFEANLPARGTKPYYDELTQSWEQITDFVNELEADVEAQAELPGAPGGVATLDGDAKLPESQVPDRLSEPGLSSTIAERAQATRMRLATRAGYDAARSSGLSQAAALIASSFTEAWADLTQWAGTAVAVSAGKLFGTTGGGGINRGFRVPVGQTARAVFKVNYVSGAAAGQGVFVGVNRGTVGAAPLAGAAQSAGVYFRSFGGAADGQIRALYDGAQDGDNIMFTGLGTSTWMVAVTVDENYLTLTVTTEAGAKPRIVRRWARNDASFPINNLSIMVNDARGASGSSVEPITEARNNGLVTGATLTGGVTGHWSSSSGDNFLILLPAGYDSLRPNPAVVLFHGNGSDETHWITNANGKAVADAFLAAGFVVIAAANTGAVSTWGADAGLDAYTRAYQYARDHYNIGAVVFYANSMGSIESLNVLARDAIPGVAAWVGTVPTFDLAENHANALFTATIDAAYGGNYPVNSVGHDPALFDPLAFRGVPMWMLIATDDASVTPGPNGQALYAAIEHTNPRTKVETTGGHSTAAIAAQASTMAAWAATQIGSRTTWPA